MAANAFLSGFTGGMGAMSNVMNYAEQRQQRQQQMQDQENLRYFSAVAHGYNGMDDDQKKAFQQVVVDRMNADQGVQDLLSRNVGHNEQKRISSKFGEMTAEGFVPYIDVVDGRTGEVMRTAPLTEFGNSDGSDKPVAISRDDFMNTMGAFLGQDDFGRQAELEILRSGGSLPDKPETFTQEMVNGVMVNRSNRSNYVEPIAGMGGKSRSGSGGSGGSDLGRLPGDYTDPDGNRVVHFEQDGRIYQSIYPADGEPGEFQTYDVTDNRRPRGVAGGDSHVDRIMHGVNNPAGPRIVGMNGIQNQKPFPYVYQHNEGESKPEPDKPSGDENQEKDKDKSSSDQSESKRRPRVSNARPYRRYRVEEHPDIDERSKANREKWLQERVKKALEKNEAKRLKNPNVPIETSWGMQ